MLSLSLCLRPSHAGMPFIFQRIEQAWLEYIGDDGTARPDHGHGGHASAAHVHAKAVAASPSAEELAAATATVGETAAEEDEEEEEAPIVEVLPHSPATRREDATVLLVKSSPLHPHHPHTHPPSLPSSGAGASPTPSPHHHIVPRVLSEEAPHRLPRHHGVDVNLVEELDADWTDVPAKGNTVNHSNRKNKHAANSGNNSNSSSNSEPSKQSKQ